MPDLPSICFVFKRKRHTKVAHPSFPRLARIRRTCAFKKNSPMDKKERLEALKKELEGYLPALSQAADTIRTEGVSKYPILVLHKLDVDIGIPIIDRHKVKGDWSVNASTLEEFVTKRLIQADQVDRFRQVYKDPDEYICLFVLSDLGANFVFLPRQ